MKGAVTSLTPSKLRIILLVMLLLITAAGSGAFYFAYGMLNKSADEAGDQVALAQESETTLQKLQALKVELDEKRDMVDKTSRVTANSQNYTYQDQLVNDLTTYASKAGLGIENISFTTQAASAAPAAPAEGEAQEATGAPSGLRSATVNITLKTPAGYQNLLNFLHYVEQNLTKLKISRVSLTKGSQGMTIDALSLEVYIR